VGIGIGTDDARLELAAIRETDDDPLRAVDDVVVREYVALCINDEPATRAALYRCLALRQTRDGERHATRCRRRARLHFDLHDGRQRCRRGAPERAREATGRYRVESDRTVTECVAYLVARCLTRLSLCRIADRAAQSGHRDDT